MDRTEKLEIDISGLKFLPDDYSISWVTDEVRLSASGIRKLFKFLQEHGMVFKDGYIPMDLHKGNFEELDLKEKE